MDKQFIVKLTEIGPNPPVATIIRNDLGGIPVWTYDSDGVYTATLAGAFTPAAKTIIEDSSIFSSQVNDADSFTITIISGGDDELLDTLLKLTVYDATYVPVVPTGYCTQHDMELRLGVQQLADLTNEQAGSTSADVTVVASMIVMAEVLIDSKLAESYDVPFTLPAPKVINEIATELACYYCMERRYSTMGVPALWASLKKDKDDQLEAISMLLESIPEVDPVTKEADIESPAANPDMDIDFNNPRNKFSRY
jgi:hypothetical protein